MELIIVIVIIGVVILTISGATMFFVRHIAAKTELYNIYGQINYAFDDMKLRCISAIRVAQLLSPAIPQDSFEFTGERNVFQITPNDLTDNAVYRYEIDLVTGDLVLLKDGVLSEVLVESRYSPQLIFEWNNGWPPNVLRVTIIAQGSRASIMQRLSRTTTVRFWFLDVASSG
jgi:hypothetical protein